MRLGWMMAIGAVICVAAPAGDEKVVPTFLKHMTGCFELQFHYVEEGATVLPAFRRSAHEYIQLIVEKDAFFLQHWGSAGWRHWGHRWTYQDKQKTWHQVVTGPDIEEIRYECTSAVREGDNVAQSRCEATGAPLPIRDQERDYDSLDRVHIYNITKDVWHDVQHNKKIKDGKAIITETGWNEYRRVEDKFCAKAIEASKPKGR